MLKNPSWKFSSLFRIESYGTHLTQKNYFQVYIKKLKVQLSPLLWMLYSRTLKNTFNRIVTQTLRITLINNIKSFLEVLASSKNIAYPHRNTQIYWKNYLIEPTIYYQKLMARITSDNYLHLRSFWEFVTERTRYGLENVKCRSAQIWSLLAEAIKMPITLHKFKLKVKN